MCVFINLCSGCQSLSWESAGFFLMEAQRKSRKQSRMVVPIDLLFPVSIGKLLRSYIVQAPAKRHPL